MSEKVAAALSVRQATAADASPMGAILNPIITAGGTTAIEWHLSDAEIAEWFITGEHCLACSVAEDDTGRMLGFQALVHQAELPEHWADIATFACSPPRPSGVGVALFEATLQQAADAGIRCINATIRADNVNGLAYYTRLGFETYDVSPGVPLKDGTPVDRLHKRFLLQP